MPGDAFYQLRIRKTPIFAGVAFLLVVGTVLVLGELLVRFANPQPYMMPRYQYSPLYGHGLPPSTVMTAARPGEWEFRYTINEYGYRGPAIPISNSYDRTNVVVLGDSYSMGVGVDDDEVYSAVLSRELGDCFDVVNLGVGGYGLSHEIRRFYEFGVLYRPQVVVLQFFHNDPSDDLEDRITRVEDGRFRFRPTSHRVGWLKQMLSDSVIQYSQVYNLARNFAYRTVRSRRLADSEEAAVETPVETTGKPSAVPQPGESLYIDLLDAFANDLKERKVDLILIAVNGALDRFPAIARRVGELDRAGRLHYVEVEGWFEGVSDYGSPEGHSWGAKAHRIVGENLARVIVSEGTGPGGAWPRCDGEQLSARGPR